MTVPVFSCQAANCSIVGSPEARLDIQHMKTVKQLNATDMTKTTKLTMRLVTICIQSNNARTVTTNKHKRDILPRTLFKNAIIIIIINRMQTNKPEMTKYILCRIY